jgi:hypothetical protein
VIPELVRLVVSMLVHAPTLTLGLLCWASFVAARRLDVPKWMAVIAPVGVAWFLWRRRHSRLAVALLAAVWFLLLWAYPSLRFAAGVAIPVGVLLGGLVWLADRYPHVSPWHAVQFAVLERRHREVLADAVPASAGEGARVVKDSVHVAANGDFQAEIVGPAGVSHADLLSLLRDTLAESVYALSGRRMAHVSVVGAGAKGGALVRGSAVSPYGQPISLEDL